MLTRPFAPFRPRPVRRTEVRKSADAEVILELAAETPISIKTLRRAGRVINAGPPRLRVLNREKAET